MLGLKLHHVSKRGRRGAKVILILAHFNTQAKLDMYDTLEIMLDCDHIKMLFLYLIEKLHWLWNTLFIYFPSTQSLVSWVNFIIKVYFSFCFQQHQVLDVAFEPVVALFIFAENFNYKTKIKNSQSFHNFCIWKMNCICQFKLLLSLYWC